MCCRSRLVWGKGFSGAAVDCGSLFTQLSTGERPKRRGARGKLPSALPGRRQMSN